MIAGAAPSSTFHNVVVLVPGSLVWIRRLKPKGLRLAGPALSPGAGGEPGFAWRVARWQEG